MNTQFSPLTLTFILSASIACSAGANLEEGKQAYENGDYQAATEQLLPLAEQGNAEAQYYLGMSLGTIPPPPNAGKAITWFLKAAEQGHPGAQYQAGWHYDLAKDYTQAQLWYHKAANQGYVAAYVQLGYLYDSGYGVPQDYAEGLKWYRKAADRGHATSQFYVAIAYRRGERVPQDYVLAHMWYNLAASQNEMYLRTAERN